MKATGRYFTIKLAGTDLLFFNTTYINKKLLDHLATTDNQTSLTKPLSSRQNSTGQASIQFQHVSDIKFSTEHTLFTLNTN